MTTQSRSPSQQLRANSITSLGYFIFNAAIGLWLVRFLIDHIGVAGYGLIALAVSLTAYVGLAAGSVNTSISRFLSLDVNRENFLGANITFNSALAGISAGIVVLIPLLWAFVANITTIVEVPEEFADTAPRLFWLLILAFFLAFVRNVFTAPAFAHNRLDLIFFSQGLELLTKVATLVLIMHLLTPNVAQFGAASVIGAAVALFYGIYLWRTFAPYLSLSRSAVRVNQMSRLFAMSGWMTVNQTGTILFLNVDLIIANLFVGAAAAGYYGALLQVSIAIRSLAGVLAGVATPLIFSRYAKADYEDLALLVSRSIRFLGLTIALPVGFVCAAAHPILSLWLGPDFPQFVALVWAMTFHLGLNVACRPLFAVQQAANAVRNPALVTLLLGAAHVGFSVLLVERFGLGLYGIAISGIVTLTLKNSIYTLIHAAVILGQPIRTLLSPVAIAAFGTVLSVLISFAILSIVPVGGWGSLFFAALLIGLAYVGVVWYAVLDAQEQRVVRDVLSRGM